MAERHLPVSSFMFQAAFMPGSLRNSAGQAIKGTNVWKSGALFGRPGVGFQHSWNMAVKGTLPLMVVGGALAAATAPRGHALSAASRTIGSTLGTIIGGTLTGGIGILAGGWLGDEWIGKPIERGMQALHDFAGNVRRLDMGGNYQDSQAAFTMRQVAVREMGSSLLNARRHLGQESALMHT